MTSKYGSYKIELFFFFISFILYILGGFLLSVGCSSLHCPSLLIFVLSVLADDCVTWCVILMSWLILMLSWPKVEGKAGSYASLPCPHCFLYVFLLCSSVP